MNEKNQYYKKTKTKSYFPRFLLVGCTWLVVTSIYNGKALSFFQKYYTTQSGSNKENQHQNNRSNQLNTKNKTCWDSKDYNGRPNINRNQSTSTTSKAAINNRSNQLNPNNAAYSSSRGYNGSSNYSSSQSSGSSSSAAMNNHSNQMNPNNAAYSSSRGSGSKK